MALLVIILLAFGLIFGIFSREQVFRKIGRVLLIVALSPILLGAGKNYYAQLPPVQKVVLPILIIPLVLILLLRLLLGKDLFSDIIGNFFYDGIKFIVSLPFRIASRLIRNYK